MGGYKVQILVVEDNPADVELLRRALSSAKLDYELTVLDDGAEALAYVRQQGDYSAVNAPDLAVLDMNLPKHDGLEVLTAMRASPKFTEVPVAILSSSSSPRERARMEKLNLGRYLTKPPELEAFLKIGDTLKELLLESGFQSKLPGI